MSAARDTGTGRASAWPPASCPGAWGQEDHTPGAPGSAGAAAAARTAAVLAAAGAHPGSPPSQIGLGELGRAARAGNRVRAFGSRHPVQHPGQLGAKRAQPGDLSVDTGDMPAQHRLRRAAGAHTGAADRQQVTDLGQPQAEPLRAADEQQPVQRIRAVAAMVSAGAGRGGQQPGPLLVAHRVDSHPGAGSHLPDRQAIHETSSCHAATLRPGAGSRIKPARAVNMRRQRRPR